MDRLISFDLKADFGFLRKPDTNDGISMSYNMLHKPALLGILGAILGYEGYQKRGELPKYYQKLSAIQLGIQPLDSQKGNFTKTTITYTNTIGYANKDGNFITYENTLIKPSYRIFVKLEKDHPLFDYIFQNEAEYLPYLGKNEFPVWWENVQSYDLRPFEFEDDFTVDTIFLKEDTVSDKEKKSSGGGILGALKNLAQSFFFFENLPIGFQEFSTRRGKEYQYKLAPFAYTNATFVSEMHFENLYEISAGRTIQLF